MKAFDFISVETIAEACNVLSRLGPDASLLAGGTDLLIGLRRPSAKPPKVIIDISRVAELHGIGELNGDVLIGPLTTHSHLLRSGTLRRFSPLLPAAAASIGSPQIRSRGTIGGNLMNAAACADTLPPLVALDAAVALQSASGRRELPLAKLVVKPYQTRANPDELLAAIRFKKLAPPARSAFIKLGRRNALAISRLSVAAVLELGDDGKITDARIVPGAAFPTWRRVTSAEELLLGQKPSDRLFAAAGQKVSEEMIKETGRRWSTEYKEPVIAVLVRRALQQCVAAGASRLTLRAPKSAPASPVSRTSRNGNGNPSKEWTITATINGRARTLTLPVHLTLLDLLRDHLGLTGTKCGCEIGECGACTVLLDGEPVNSCLVLAPQIDGHEITTVEGLAQNGKLHRLQESFLDYDAVHCGFCTPGMLVSAKALLDWNPRPSETEIRTAISGNLCRCTGYQQIVDAIAGCKEQGKGN